MVSHLIEQAVGMVWYYPVTILCLFSGIFFTFYRMKLVQFRTFSHAIDLLRGRYDNPKEHGQISHFQALSAALSATIGLGNISGVAIAIAAGGPGAIFWMWIIGLFGMATKFVECTLGTMYRDEDPKTGEVRGGPMQYIEKGLGKRWKPMAVFFAACTAMGAFGAGGMFQSNQSAQALYNYLGVKPEFTGIVLSILVAIVILGGIKRIGSVASKVVPMMCFIYVVGALLICLLNIDKIPTVFAIIIQDAFTGSAALGGSLGTVIIWGVRRAVFSNEAGLGSAPIAHAAVKTDYPVREGIVAAVGPLIDTIIVCSATATIIIMSGLYGTGIYSPMHVKAPKVAIAAPSFDKEDGWSISKNAPAERKTLQSHTGNAEPLFFAGNTRVRSGYATASSPLIPIVETKTVNGEIKRRFLADGLRFSVHRGSGTHKIVLRTNQQNLFTSFKFDGTSNTLYFSRSGKKPLDPLFSLSRCDKEGEWQTCVLTFGKGLSELVLRQPETTLDSIMIEFMAKNGSGPVYIDRVELVKKLNGIALTIAAFDTFLAGFGSKFIALAVFLFAFSTMISWSYYGETAAMYVFGRRIVNPYKWAFITTIFLGSVLSLSEVINFTDLMIGLMVVPNTLAILLLSKKVAEETGAYLKKLRAGGYKQYK